ncbi:hypothetical protein MNZ22_02125 [Aeromonas encheleia]|uniref:hypothetical protein n=1 Tax=Aeromonas encheleia TaxID=73010 RepID=UPI001F5908AA|nr:hypothetical protein [Aeromonas encheleia]UNP89290.1 hypothetical protein MNZ22_02125 [Aeromonas encheleia]
MNGYTTMLLPIDQCSSESQNMLRKLSKHELSQLAWHTIHFSLDLIGIVTREKLIAAVRDVARRTPLACSKVVRINNNYHFEAISVDSIPIRKLYVSNDDEYDLFYREIINTAVDATESQLSVILINRSTCLTLLVSMAHSIVSGRTGAEFLHSIMAEYNGVNCIQQVSDFKIKPSMSEYSAKFKKNIKPIPYVDVEKQALNFSPIPFDLYENSNQSYETDFIDIIIQGDLFERLLLTCKNKGVSVNSFLSAAQLIATMRCYPGHKDFDYVSHNLAIDARAFIPNDLIFGDLMQFSYSALFYFRSRDIKCIWVLAREISERVKQYVNSDFMHATIVGLEESEYCVEDVNKPIVDDSFSWTTCNSNLGVVSFNCEKESVKVANFNFIVNRINASHLIFISTFNNILTMRYAFSQPRYSWDNINLLCSEIYNEIYNNLQQETT